ncbi:hypothetical protein D3C71_1161410 [compost metagenome]
MHRNRGIDQNAAIIRLHSFDGYQITLHCRIIGIAEHWPHTCEKRNPHLIQPLRSLCQQSQIGEGIDLFDRKIHFRRCLDMKPVLQNIPHRQCTDIPLFKIRNISSILFTHSIRCLQAIILEGQLSKGLGSLTSGYIEHILYLK